jgi:Xaa-Pro aminopeptidase
MNRINGLRERLAVRRLKAFIVSDIKNIRYLTGFRGSTALLLITDRGIYFFTDFRYREQSLREVHNCEIIVPHGSLLSEVKRTLKSHGLKRVGFESDASYSLYHNLRRSFTPVPLREMVESIRAVKEKEEIRHISKAVKRAEDAFRDVKGIIRPGVTEKTIASRLEMSLKEKGCNHIPFDIIVASGRNASLPHAETTDKKLQPGDLVVIDWGGEHEGYFSDITRTFLIKGEGVDEKIRIYNTVLKANRAAIKSAEEGIKASVLDRAAREVIKDAGYGSFFGHATGHGVGLDIHESPRISQGSNAALSRGMVFTIEPGVYIPDVGGVRIEDMVCIGEKGARVLTHLPRRLEIIQ